MKTIQLKRTCYNNNYKYNALSIALIEINDTMPDIF